MERDYVVIGGGIMGVCTAYHLVMASNSVLLLERRSIAPRPPISSSGDVAKIFRTAYGDKQHLTRLSQRSLEWWRHFEDEDGSQLVVPCGMVVFGAADARSLRHWREPEAAAWAAKSFRTMCTEGIDCELLSKKALLARYPQIADRKSYDVALIDGSAGLLYASRAVLAIARLAEAAGLEIWEDAAVERVVRSGRDVHGLVVNGEIVSARHAVVFAAGAMNQTLVPELRSKVRITRQQIVHFALQEQDQDDLLGLPIIVSLDARRYLYVLPDGTIAVADDENRDQSKLVDPARDISPHADESFWREASAFAGVHVPALSDHLPRREGKSCLYSNTVSQEYLIYRKGNAVVISACSGHGFKNGPTIGLMAAELGMGRDSRWYSDAFRYERAKDYPSSAGAR